MRLVLIKRSFSAVIALLMVLTFSFAETARAQKDTTLPRDVIVVCHEDLRNGLGPWISHREKQGYRIQVLAPSNSAFDQYKAIIEDVIISDAVLSMVRLVRGFEENTRFQSWTLLFSDPCQFEFLFPCHMFVIRRLCL